MNSPVVEVHGLRAEFGEHTVLAGLNLQANLGEIVAVTGANGTGKSTLLRCLAGLHPPADGVVRVLGAPPADGAAFWRAVGLAAGEPTWYPALTTREHLELVRLTHEPVSGSWPTATDVLAAVGLTERADDIPPVLSFGQRKRLVLAAVLVRPSRLLLLDEPEQGLDPDFRARLAVLLREYAGGGGTVVMATHDLALAGLAGARQFVLPAGERTGSVR